MQSPLANVELLSSNQYSICSKCHLSFTLTIYFLGNYSKKHWQSHVHWMSMIMIMINNPTDDIAKHKWRSGYHVAPVPALTFGNILSGGLSVER